MQRKLRARKKGKSARRLNLIQQKRLTINKHMYVVLNIQYKESGQSSHFFIPQKLSPKNIKIAPCNIPKQAVP